MKGMNYKKYRGVPNSLRECREHHGLTQGAVGKLLGFKDGTWISKWENGETIPSLISAARLSVIYGVSINDLFHNLISSVR